jgi:predicted nuclease of restriction endonuclease-like RecB superfamily
MQTTECPKCGKPKKPWFNLCFDCNEKEKQKPICEVCGIEVEEGHNLCKPHWIEKKEEEKKLKQIGHVKDKKETDFREKFEGKFYFKGMPVKSKSELLLLYFLDANGLNPQYETPIYLNGKEYRPDFIICNKDNMVIIEHFGIDEEDYNKKKDVKIKEYEKLCNENKNWFFIWTEEKDIYNLKDRLGKKLNDTPLNRIMWR